MKQRHKRKQCLIFKHYRSILTELKVVFKPYMNFEQSSKSEEHLEVVVDFSLVKPKIKTLLSRLQYLKRKYSS